MKYLSLKLPGSDGNPIEVGAPENIPQGVDAPSNIINTVFIYAIVGGVLLALIFMLWGGIKWITSRGDKEKVENARKTIIYALIGFVIILLAFVFINIFGELTGIEFLENLGKRDPVPPTDPFYPLPRD